MKLQTKLMVMVCAAGFFSVGAVKAQTTPAPTATSSGTAPAPAAKKPAQTGTGTGTAAKSGTGTGTGTATHRAAAPLVLKTDREKASYAVGQSMAKSLQSRGFTTTDIDTAILARGVRDALTNAKPAMTEEEQKTAVTALMKSAQTKMEAKNQVTGDANKKVGDAFLAANKTKDGVVTLPSGLQYKIITAGTGPKPTAADTVVCNYPRHVDRRKGI